MVKSFRFASRGVEVEPANALRNRVRRAEALGYYAYLMSDHVAGPGPAMAATGHPPAGLACIPTMMLLAEASSTIRIGTRVIGIDYHIPVTLARDLATLDLLSGGRLEVGLGAGWIAAEYDAIGIPFDPAPVRIERLDEAITLLKALFQPGEVSHHGKYFHAHGFEGAPQPTQRPYPPIAVGGGAKKILQLAARQADIVCFNYDNRSGQLGADGVQRTTDDLMSQRVGWVREAAGDRFAALELEVGINKVAVTDEPRAAAEQYGAQVGLTVDQVLTHPHVLIGTVDSIVEELLRRREAYGISYISIHDRFAVDFAPVVDRLAGT